MAVHAPVTVAARGRRGGPDGAVGERSGTVSVAAQAGERLEARRALARPGERPGPPLDELRVRVAGGLFGADLPGRDVLAEADHRAGVGGHPERARDADIRCGRRSGVASARAPVGPGIRGVEPARACRRDARPAAPATRSRHSSDDRRSRAVVRLPTTSPAAMTVVRASREDDRRRRRPRWHRSPVSRSSKEAVATGPVSTEAPARARRSPAVASSWPAPTSNTSRPGRIPCRSTSPMTVRAAITPGRSLPGTSGTRSYEPVAATTVQRGSPR